MVTQADKVSTLSETFFGVSALVGYSEQLQQEYSGDELNSRLAKVLLAIEAVQNVTKQQLVDLGYPISE